MGETITGIDSWPRPKRPEQWADGRSAKELAQRWFQGGAAKCPRELIALLDTETTTANFAPVEGYPEHRTSLPERGEGRNHDLMLRGTSNGGDLVVCVEAKVDETFGRTIGDYLQKAAQSAAPTRVPQRVEALMRIVFGPDTRGDQAPWSNLRYQLLTATAGCAIEAARRDVRHAVLVVHELHTKKYDGAKGRANADDYERFVAALMPNVSAPLESGVLYGPVTVATKGFLTRDVTLFIGKVIYPQTNIAGAVPTAGLP